MLQAWLQPFAVRKFDFFNPNRKSASQALSSTRHQLPSSMLHLKRKNGEKGSAANMGAWKYLEAWKALLTPPESEGKTARHCFAFLGNSKK